MKKKQNNGVIITGFAYLAVFLLGMAAMGFFQLGHGQTVQVPAAKVELAAPDQESTIRVAQTQPEASQDSWQTIERTAPIVAVNSAQDQGVVGTVSVQLIPGDGNVLVETSPFSMPDLQDSANTAVQVANQLVATKPSFDYLFSYNMKADLVGGGSGGAAETITTIAAMEGKEINPSVAITGTINADGSIGPVGGLLEKSQAVAAAGYKTFLVPPGQSLVTEYQKVVSQRSYGNRLYYVRQIVPKTVDLRQENPNLQIVEVSTIQDAMKYMLL